MSVQSTQVGFRIRGIEPTDLSTYPDRIKLMFWEFVTEAALQAKDKELAKGWDKDGNVHPLHPKTIRYRKSAVGPVHKHAPRLIPALDLSRVRSLLTGRAHTTSSELWWKFDPVTGRSFAEILHYQAEKYGHDVFGLSPAGTAWVTSEATKQWSAWKAAGGVNRATAEVPGAKVSRKPEFLNPIRKINLAGVKVLKGFDIAGDVEQVRRAILEGTSPGFRRLNTSFEQWTPGTGLGRGGRQTPPPPQPAPQPKPKPKPSPATATFQTEVDAMMAKRQSGQSGTTQIHALITKHATDVGEHAIHGMATPERFKAFQYGGVEWRFSDALGMQSRVAGAIHDFHRDLHSLPERLRTVTSKIWFVDQGHKDEAYWKNLYANLGTVAATGGDGQIVFYKNRFFYTGAFAHESGHNLAMALFGHTDPTRGHANDYEKLVMRGSEPPVSEYATNSPAEDFAEACRFYVEHQNKMRVEFPERFAVIHKLMTDPTYGG